MAKHLPSKVWSFRKEGTSNGHVVTIDKQNISVYYYSDMNDTNSIVDFDINRTDARILAKRILQCLDDTK